MALILPTGLGLFASTGRMRQTPMIMGEAIRDGIEQTQANRAAQVAEKWLLKGPVKFEENAIVPIVVVGRAVFGPEEVSHAMLSHYLECQVG